MAIKPGIASQCPQNQPLRNIAVMPIRLDESYHAYFLNFLPRIGVTRKSETEHWFKNFTPNPNFRAIDQTPRAADLTPRQPPALSPDAMIERKAIEPHLADWLEIERDQPFIFAAEPHYDWRDDPDDQWYRPNLAYMHDREPYYDFGDEADMRRLRSDDRFVIEQYKPLLGKNLWADVPDCSAAAKMEANQLIPLYIAKSEMIPDDYPLVQARYWPARSPEPWQVCDQHDIFICGKISPHWKIFHCDAPSQSRGRPHGIRDSAS